MNRTMKIVSAEFDGMSLPLCVSMQVSRVAEPDPAAGDADRFTTSVQTLQAGQIVTLKLRDLAAAEAPAIGQYGPLTVRLRSGGPSADRLISLDGAVLLSQVFDYAQNAPALATLRFACEAADGADPLTSEEIA